MTEGRTATFTVEASVANGTLAYQWQMLINAKWVNITDATNVAYTTGATALVDNGTRYRCVVTNTEPDKSPTKATSDTVTLTVTAKGAKPKASIDYINE